MARDLVDDTQQQPTAAPAGGRALVDDEQPTPPPGPVTLGPGTTAAIHFQRHLSLLPTDKLNAAVMALGEISHDKTGKKHLSDFPEIYQRNLAFNDQVEDASDAAHPVARWAGNVAGVGAPLLFGAAAPVLARTLGAAPEVIPAAEGAITEAAPQAAKALTRGGRILKKTLEGLKIGIPTGAAGGYANSRAPDATGTLEDTGLGAALGGLTGVGLPLTMEGLGALAPLLRKGATRAAVEALGTKLPQYRALEYQDATEPLGAELLDKKIIPWLGGVENIAQRAGAEMEKQGKTIGSTIDALDAKAGDLHQQALQAAIPKLAAETKPSSVLIPAEQLGIRAPLEQISQGPFAGAEEGAGTVDGRGRPLTATEQGFPTTQVSVPRPQLPQYHVPLDAVRSAAMSEVVNPMSKLPRIAVGDTPARLGEDVSSITNPMDRYTIRQSNDVLGGMDQRIGDAYKKEGTQYAEGLKRVRGILRGQQQAAAERIDPELAAQLTQAKTSYGNMARAARISEDSALRRLSNRDFAPTDYAAGLTEFMRNGEGGAGDAGKAALFALLHKMVRERGNAFAARMLDAMSSGADASQLPAVQRASEMIAPQMGGYAPRALRRSLGAPSP